MSVMQKSFCIINSWVVKKMNDINQYLDKIKSAAEKYFDSWHEYTNILYEVEKPHFYHLGELTEETQKEYDVWRLENEAAINKSLENEDKYVDELFAQSTFAGAILELAYAGIKRFSTNRETYSLVNEVIKPGSKFSRFCIGRIENKLPIGLIILGGRNLHNHINEDELKEPNITIFNILTGKGFSKYINSYYDIDGGQRYNVLSNLIHLLNWNSFVEFKKIYLIC